LDRSIFEKPDSKIADDHGDIAFTPWPNADE